MFRKNICTTILLFFIFTINVNAQYYAAALGKNGPILKTVLHNIIKGHNFLLYQDLWAAFENTDAKSNGKVWDMYTDIPNGTPNFIFNFGTNQCGNYSGEGDCFNREHSWPKEYFGGDNSYPMYSDLHHLFATDGWVNNKHAAFPFGMVNSTTYTSSNGTKLGTGATYPGYSNKIFEPIDPYKGDFARAYFYMSTRYESEDATWQNWEMANGAELTPAAVNLLLLWHNNDPVSQKEIDRNEAVFLLQGNRNPFIDYPQFADCIWGSSDCSALAVKENDWESSFTLFPNPSNNHLAISTPSNTIIYSYSIIDLVGKQIVNNHFFAINILTDKLAKGNYILQLNTNKGIVRKLFSKE
jgi:endonuclease I